MDQKTVKKTSNNILHRFFSNHYSTGTITRAEQLTASIVQIQIQSDAMAQRTYIPGQHVRIQINDPLSMYGLLRPIETLRSYTVWAWDDVARIFELRIHMYGGDGIGQRWAREVNVGDKITYWGPMGNFNITPGSYHLFVGEETATFAFDPMIRSLSQTEQEYGVLESDSPQVECPISDPQHRITRVYRHGESAVNSQRLLDAVMKLELPTHPGRAYIAGEVGTCRMILNHLMHDRGWGKSAIQVKPFWAPGKRGLH